MAHVHAAKLAETAKKVTEKAGSGMKGMAMGESMGKMMEHGMGGMMTGDGLGKMMEGGMPGMMAGQGMRNMMEHGTGAMMMAPRAAAAAGAATGVAVTATRHSLLRRIVGHPLVLFGAGLAIGFLIHKYREEIIGKAGATPE
jgi:hypothetical protein